MPFTVADFQRVVVFGTIGIVRHLYQLIRLIGLKVGQQVHSLRLLDFFRGKIRHLLSFLPVRLTVIILNRCIGAAFNDRLYFRHVGAFVFLPGIKGILQRMG